MLQSLRAGLAAGLLVLVLAPVAWAQNGLERFERDIKPQLQLESLTYADAAPLGDKGFELGKVVAVVPANAATGDKASTVRIERVRVDALDFERLAKGAQDDSPPRFASLRIEGLTGTDELFQALAPWGIPKVTVDFALDYSLDGARRVLEVRTLEIALRDLAKLVAGVVVDGVSDRSGIAGARDEGRLRSASLSYDDSGLLGHMVPALADDEGLKPKEVIDTALAALAAFADGQGPATLKVLDALASFVGDWRAPKGTLSLTLRPARTASLQDLDRVLEPNALTDLFGLAATYPGMRPGAALAGPGAK